MNFGPNAASCKANPKTSASTHQTLTMEMQTVAKSKQPVSPRSARVFRILSGERAQRLATGVLSFLEEQTKEPHLKSEVTVTSHDGSRRVEVVMNVNSSLVWPNSGPRQLNNWGIGLPEEGFISAGKDTNRTFRALRTAAGCSKVWQIVFGIQVVKGRKQQRSRS